MLGKKLKILLAVGAASAVMLAAGCGGGDSKSSSASGKGGIPAVIRSNKDHRSLPRRYNLLQEQGYLLKRPKFWTSMQHLLSLEYTRR